MKDTAELVTPEMRATCLEAHDEILHLRSRLDEAHSQILRLQLSLSCVLPIAEQTSNPVDARTCALIRQTLGLPPLRGTPKLAIVS